MNGIRIDGLLNKKLDDRYRDTPGKPLQRRMSLEVMDALAEIVGQSPYCVSNVSLSSLADGITPLWDD